jgi:hypothetical protein
MTIARKTGSPRLNVQPAARALMHATLLAAAVGCSGGGVTLGAECGEGTKNQNGVCVASPLDGGVAAVDAPADSAEESAADGGEGIDAPVTPLMADTGTDATQTPDAVNTDPLTTPDPCPDSSLPPLWADCSNQCPSQGGSFDAGTCGTSGDYALVCPAPYTTGVSTILPSNMDLTIRTPATAQPACQSQCLSDVGPPVTAAIVFAAPANGTFTIQVDLPWRVSVIPNQGGLAQGTLIGCEGPLLPKLSTPCVDAHSGLYAVWTDVPAPPPRNIVVRQHASCP